MPKAKKPVEKPVSETSAAAEEPKKPVRKTKKVTPEEVVREVKEEVASAVDSAGKSVKKVMEKVEEQMEKQSGKKVEKKAVVRSKKKAAAAPAITIQSMMGGEISLDKIISLVNEKAAGKTVSNIYIKSEENKAYYVADGEDGFVELWD